MGGSATFVSEPFTCVGTVGYCSMKSQAHMNLLLINGIMTQLQGVVPLLNFITTHCATHLSLTVSQACEVVPCAERFERLVNDMYIFSSHSTT